MALTVAALFTTAVAPAVNGLIAYDTFYVNLRSSSPGTPAVMSVGFPFDHSISPQLHRGCWRCVASSKASGSPCPTDVPIPGNMHPDTAVGVLG